MKILVLHPKDPALSKHRGKSWIYCDEKLSVYACIEKILDQEHRLFAPRDFQTHASEIHGKFVEWADANISTTHEDDWVLTPLHRNPFVNNIQLHLTWLSLLASQAERISVVLITECLGLWRAVKQNEEIFKVVESTVFSRVAFSSGLTLGRLRVAARFVRDAIRFLYVKLISHGFINEKKINELRSADVLLERYIQDENLSMIGGYADPYSGRLIDWYQENAIRCALIVRDLNVGYFKWPNFMKRMKLCETPIVPYERLVPMSGWIRSVGTIIRMALSCPQATSHFGKLDTSALVQSARFEAILSNLYGLLYKYLPGGMHREAIRPKLILDWFENQPLDRAMALGMRRSLPGVRWVGLRQYTLFPLCSYLYVSKIAVSQGIAPRECLVSSRRLSEQLASLDSHTKLIVVPALRYQHVRPRDSVDHYRSPPALLVLLTHSLEESWGILNCLLPVIEAMGSLWTGKLVLKPHPTIGISRQKREVERSWPWIRNIGNLDWVASSIDNEIRQAGLVVSAGSSAALEAVCTGIPAIIVGRKAGLDMNPLSGLDQRLWREAYDRQEMAAILNEWWPNHPLPMEARRALAAEILEHCFEPISPDGMKKFGSHE